MSTTQYVGELSRALETLVRFLENKGQLPNLADFLTLIIVESILNKYTRIKLHIDWEKLVALSINSPTYRKPLWLEALAQLSKLGATTNIITEVSQRKKLLSVS